MDWHNFKVMFVYAVIICVILFIMGQDVLAITALVGYSLFGFTVCLNQNHKTNKIHHDLAGVPEHMQEIVTCHIVKRNPKLKKRDAERVKSNIAKGDYQIKTYMLTDKTSVADDEPDGGIYYLLTFDNIAKYCVRSITYDNAHIGDTLYIVTTPSDVIKVIRSKSEYFNMLEHPLFRSAPQAAIEESK